nr:hypothetical protein [Tanacetum cinerariifolium]
AVGSGQREGRLRRVARRFYFQQFQGVVRHRVLAAPVFVEQVAGVDNVERNLEGVALAAAHEGDVLGYADVNLLVLYLSKSPAFSSHQTNLVEVAGVGGHVQQVVAGVAIAVQVRVLAVDVRERLARKAFVEQADGGSQVVVGVAEGVARARNDAVALVVARVAQLGAVGVVGNLIEGVV